MSEEQSEKQVAVRLTREVRVTEDNLIVVMDTAKFEHMSRIANFMAAAELIPDHLRGTKRKGEDLKLFPMEVIRANCFMVVNQAVRWGMDPFAVAPETYAIGGKLAYQGKLIAAVVNTRAGLEGRLDYVFTGKRGDNNLTVEVRGTFRGDDEPKTITLSVGEAQTDNQMWKKDPEQKLIYSAVVKWARRWCPEVVLGILTDDDLERIRESDRGHLPEIKPDGGQTRREPIDLTKTASTPEKAPAPQPEIVKESPAAVVEEPVKEKPARTPLENPFEELSMLCSENSIEETDLAEFMKAENIGSINSKPIVATVVKNFDSYIDRIKAFAKAGK